MKATALKAEPMVWRGTEFLRIEIMQAVEELETCSRVITASARTMSDAFNKQEMINIKLASEHLKVAAAQAVRKSSQIEALAGSMATTFGQHVNRRPRV